MSTPTSEVGVITNDQPHKAPEDFRSKWVKEYASFMDIPEPEMFPVQYTQGVPVPNPQAVARFPQATNVLAGRLGHETFTNSRGFSIGYPVAVSESGEELPIFSGASADDFKKRLKIGDFKTDERWIKHIRRYYEVAAMITGGHDNGLHTARILETLAIDRILQGKDISWDQLDESVRSSFPTYKNIVNIRRNLDTIGDVVSHCQDSGSRLRYIDSNGGDPQVILRQLVKDYPEYVLLYLTDQIAGLALYRDIYRQHDFVEEFFEGISRAATEANVGQGSDRRDFVYTNINDAISYMRDIIELEKHPYAFAVANKAVFDRTGMDYSMRFNSDYLTQRFYRMMVDERLVALSDLEEGKVIVRANIKPARALMYEVFKDQDIRNKVYEAAIKLGIKTGSSGNGSGVELLGIKEAVEYFNSVLERSAVGSSSTQTESDISGLLEFVSEKMYAQYDIIRARVYYDSRKTMNQIAVRIEGILGSLPDKVRQKLGSRAEAYVRDWIWTTEGYKDVKVKKNPYDGVQFGYGDDVGGYLAGRVAQAADGTILYEACHAHVPVNIGFGQRVGSLPNSVELQIMYGWQREMSDALDRAYKAEEQSLRGAGFSLEEVNAILHIAQEKARRVLSEEKAKGKEKGKTAFPYKGILLDFDGLMFITSPLYEKAMEDVFSECQLDPSLLRQVFKFDRSMGISCRAMVERIFKGMKLGGDLEAVVAEDIKAKLLSAERLVSWGKQVGINFDGDSGNIEMVSEIIARYFEHKGAEIIRVDPEEAKKLVKAVPGFLQFLEEISRKGVVIGVASSGRKSTIEEVFKLYNLQIKSIYAEEDVLAQSDKTGIAYKPELTFYSRAANALSKVSGLSDPLKDEEILIVGDNQKSEYHPALANMAQSFNVLLVSSDDNRLQTIGNRNVVKTRYFADVWKTIITGKIDEAQLWGDNIVIKRIIATCRS